MNKIIADAIISGIVAIVANLVSGYFVPAATERRRVGYSLLIALVVGLIALCVIVLFMPDSVEKRLVSFVSNTIDAALSSRFAWLYLLLFVSALFLIIGALVAKARAVITISSPTQGEKSYLENLIEDLDQRNMRNKWRDELYVDVDVQLRDRIDDEMPPRFYLVKPLDSKSKQQDNHNLTNIERIDSSRGTTFKSIGTAIKRATQKAVVIIAPPGGGKTVSLRNFTIRIAHQRLKEKTNQVPIFVDLGFYTGTDEDGNPQDFGEFIEQHLAESGYTKWLAERKWEKLLLDNQCAFFLDGLDELPRKGNEYEVRTRAIESFTRHWPKTPFILTCRELDYNPDLEFQQILIKPFDRKHIYAFFRKYFRRGGLRKGERAEIFSQLDQNQPILELCRNPFYLNLVCRYVHSTKRLPRNKTEMFKRIVRQAIDREVERSDAKDKDAFAETFEEAATHLASILAFRRMTTTIGLDDYETILTDHPNGAALSAMLRNVIRGDLVEFNSESRTLRFVHHRFQEFFSSLHIVHSYRDPDFTFPEGFFANIWWRETILFVAGLDQVPSDFVRQVFEAGLAYMHEQPTIEKLIRLDITTLAFECTFSSLEFADQPLRAKIRDYLISQYQNANTLEKAKILSALSLDASTLSRDIIEGALNDQSGWVSERAFFIISDGLLRLQLRPQQIVGEFWRLFMTGRLISTIPAILRASRKSRVLKMLLPVYVTMVLANVVVIGVVGYVLYFFFSFIAFHLEIALTQECLNCLFTIGFGTAIILTCLTRAEYPLLTRFILTAPLSLLILYLVFNLPSSIILRLLGIALGVAFHGVYNQYLRRQDAQNSIQVIAAYVLGLSIVSLIADFREIYIYGQRYPSIIVPLLPSYISIPLAIGFLIVILAYISTLLIRQILTLQNLLKHRNRLRSLLMEATDDSDRILALGEMFVSLKAFTWAQKILLAETVKRLSSDLHLSAEERIVFLTKLENHVHSSQLRDAVFQKIEDEERSYRRDIYVGEVPLSSS